MTKSEAMAMVAMLAAAYPAANMTEQTPDVYAEMLRDLDADAAMRAARRLISTSKWLPTIAEIRQAVAEDGAGGVNRAELAWSDVLKAISQFGIYRTPEFDDPLVRVAVAAIGWQSICNSTNADTVRAQFRMAYKAAVARLGEVGSVDRLLEGTSQSGLRGLHDTETHRQLGAAPIGALGEAVALSLVPDDDPEAA